ncbi:SrnB protein (plasmid) [Aeromonas salmonicida subsp. salmonicida A449]|nr:SrnB protein [Aeromonas salmonicida subsp. salmonicida A449]
MLSLVVLSASLGHWASRLYHRRGCLRLFVSSASKSQIDESPEGQFSLTNEARVIYVAILIAKPLQPKEASMFGKTAVVSLLIVCITALGVISLVRDSLCELEVHQGETEIRLNLAYEAKR